MPQLGLIVANGKEPSLQRVIEKGCWTPVEKFGTDDDWQAANPQGNGAFDVLFKGQLQGHVAWDLLGEHNRMNALASIAAARHAGVAIETSIAAPVSYTHLDVYKRQH